MNNAFQAMASVLMSQTVKPREVVTSLKRVKAMAKQPNPAAVRMAKLLAALTHGPMSVAQATHYLACDCEAARSYLKAYEEVGAVYVPEYKGAGTGPKFPIYAINTEGKRSIPKPR